ncbi:hypothetical protein WJX79_004334 [Trebouxia sp. C0005]
MLAEGWPVDCRITEVNSPNERKLLYRVGRPRSVCRHFVKHSRRCRTTLRANCAATDHHSFYSVLGVSRDATLAEVKTAYRRLAVKWHPDHVSGAEARQTYQAIKDAYDVLSNHTKRHHYNKHGLEGLGSHFHGYEATHDPTTQQHGGQGQNVDAMLGLTFLEAALGTERVFHVSVRLQCPDCSGSGLSATSQPLNCIACHGTGQTMRYQSSSLGRTQSYGNCPACGGKGVSSRFWCKRCGGEGRAVTPRQMRVKIPAGVDHGSVLRLNGQGDVGDFGGKRGDIMLRFVIHPEDSFTRQGCDVYSTTRVYKRRSVLLSWLRSVSKACFGTSQLLEHVVSLDVISPREAEDRVQAGAVEAVLYLDLSAARGRKGHLGFTHRLGNKTTAGPLVSEERSASRGRAATCDVQCIAKGGLQAILKIACQKADDTITLPPQLRKALVLLLAAAPKGSELVKEVVAALEQGLAEACSLSALPELILSLLQLPDVCLAARTSGLRSSLAMYFQRHQTLGVKADVSFPMDTPQPRVTRKWPFKSLLHRTKARYQMAAQEQAPSASTGAPAYLQALYQQRLLQGASPQHHSVQRHSQEAASRHESIELGARAPSTESPRLAWQASGPWLTDEEVLQQQIKCTVIKALLQLSPLVAEEPTTDHISAEAFVYELMLEDGHALHDKGGQAELRQLCIATLASLAAQPQSISTLFASPTPKDRAAPTDLQHSQPVHRHTLLVMVFKSMREASLHKQQGTLGFPKLECYLELLAEYLTLVHDPGVTSQYLCEAAKVWGPMQEVLMSFGPVALWTQRRTKLMATVMQLHTAWLNGQWQAGEAARALRGSLGNQIAGTVYLAFFFHHLTVGPPTDKTVEAVMAFGNALVGLISAVPAASAPADSRLDRSPVWCTSGRHQSGSDMLFLPLKHQAGAADMAPGIKALQQAPDKDLACPAALPEIVSLTRVQALNLFLSDAHSATYACGFHFQGFADAYASEDLQFSRQHLAALQALAKHKAEVVRQHLYELCVMDFLIRNIGLEAELHLATAVPLSSTVTSADSPAPPSTDPIGATTAMTPASLSHSRYDMSHKESFGKLSSILRLPSLPPNSTRDLEEDMQQLLEMDSQSEKSDSSSTPSSPPQSSRLTPKRPLLPALNLAGSARKGGPASLPTLLSSSHRRLTDDKLSLGSPGGAKAASYSQATPLTPILTPVNPKHGESPSQADRLKMPKLNLPCPAGSSALQLGHNSQDLHDEGGSTQTAPAENEHGNSGNNRALYEQKRVRRFLYADAELHAQMLQLIVELLLTSKGQLDPLYCSSQDPSAQQPVSVLQQHLSWAGNASMSGPLLHWAKAIGPPAIRLLRLTCRFLFDKSMYEDKQRIARGAFAQVFTCRTPKYCADTPDLAVKITDLPTAGDNPVSQMTAFKEIAIMQRLSNVSGICRVHDFGICSDSIMLAMTKYRCSLREWRHRQPEDACHQLRLYLSVFAQLASLLQAVSEQGIVHFDLKCDNVFLHALPGVSEQEFWSPASDEPPFEVVLGDFGDSHDFSQSEQDQISMNRGTECVRSPEMLLAASSTTQAATLHAGSTHAACDVWALACLLYELVTGNLLFPSDLDWPKFFITVTDASRELLSPVVRHSLEKLPAVADVLEYTLVRDPAQRPSAKHVLHRVQQALQDPRSNLCPYRQPVTLPLTPLKPLAAPALFLTPVSTVSCNHESSMADFYSNHLAAVSEQLCLGTVRVQAKLIPLNVPDQPDEEIHQAASLVPQLPAVLQHVSQALQNSSSRVLVAGSAGFQALPSYAAAARPAQAAIDAVVFSYAKE